MLKFEITTKDRFWQIYADEIISTFDIRPFIDFWDKINCEKKEGNKLIDCFWKTRIIEKIEILE